MSASGEWMPEGILDDWQADEKRFDWLAKAEFSLVPHREKKDGYFEVWWTVQTCKGRNITHPYGNPRAAIDAAMKATDHGGAK